jgi:hypothetical protein
MRVSLSTLSAGLGLTLTAVLPMLVDIRGNIFVPVMIAADYRMTLPRR